MSYDFRDARLRATAKMPYLTKLIMGTIPIEKPGLGTLATDCYMRIYYDPAVFQQWNIEEAAWVIVHECLHIMFNHAERAKFKIGQNADQAKSYVWNVAADLPVNETIRDSQGTLPKGCISREILPPALPQNDTTEVYYDFLMDNLPPSEDGQAGHGSGSGSDGQKREHEAGEPTDEDGNKDGKGGYGKDKHEQERLRRSVAHDIVDHAKARGNVPGSLLRTAKEILKPNFDPRQELRAAVKSTIEHVPGFGTTTWRRPSRREQGARCRLPSWIAPIPRPTIIIDTSGSMNDEDLGLCLGVVADVVNALPSRDGVRVITGDTRAANCQQVFSAHSVELAGGGGTDMGAIMVKAVEDYPDSDMIIVVTDGYTPWPNHELPIPCLALITTPSKDYPAPDWMRTVYIKPGVEE